MLITNIIVAHVGSTAVVPPPEPEEPLPDPDDPLEYTTQLVTDTAKTTAEPKPSTQLAPVDCGLFNI